MHQIDLGLLFILDEVSRQQKAGQMDEQSILDHLSREASRHPDAVGFPIFGPDGKLRYGVSNIVNRDVDISQRDEFSQIRDSYGHEAGDCALASFATVLKRMARTIDVPARFGGEEFVVLLVGTDISGAAEMAERIREAVSQIVVIYRGREFGFTVSIGVTAFENRDENLSEVIRRADQGMYRAKELGRNRVSMVDGKQLT